MDLPWTPGATSEFGSYIAAWSDPWYSTLALREQIGSSGTDHDVATSMPTAATLGLTVSTLPIGTPETWAVSEIIDIELEAGAFASKPQIQEAGNATTRLLCRRQRAHGRSFRTPTRH